MDDNMHNGSENGSSNRSVDFEELIHHAEEKFREGAEVFSRWAGEAKDLIDKQPGLVLAGIAIAGFVTGLILRRAALTEEFER